MTAEQFEKTSTELFELDKQTIISRIMNFKFKSGAATDYPKEYLDNQSEDRLIHILMAALASAA